MIKFGTGGWRAIIGDEFTKANVQLAVASLCELMKRQKSADRGICIGYDRRFLSHEAAMWAAEVAAACGVPCRLLNKEAPTPLIMFAVRQLSLPYGLAITASHNPALYNGVKIFTSGGRDASEQVTAEIEKIAQEIEQNNKDVNETIAVVPYEQALADGRIEIINPFNEYIDAILRHIDVDAIKKAGLKIALDPMHGVSQTSLRTILMTARCEVEVINERHDTPIWRPSAVS
jgi:phosphomannomutase